MKEDIVVITGIHAEDGFFTSYNATEIIGIDHDAGTYKSLNLCSGRLADVLNKIREGNKYGIKTVDVKREGDRAHTARLYKVPYKSIIQMCNYYDAYELGLNNMNFSVYSNENGGEYIVVNAGANKIMERLYVIKHDIQDGTMPFYYDRKGKPCSQMSFRFDMFFSSWEQAMNKKEHMYDKCTHIEKVFADPRFDPRSIAVWV